MQVRIPIDLDDAEPLQVFGRPLCVEQRKTAVVQPIDEMHQADLGSVRSAQRFKYQAGTRGFNTGFRPSRTYDLSP